MNQVKAVIFDMDGVLIDSEPLWQQAQIECLGTYKISITVDDCIKNTMGKRIDAIALTWCDMFGLKANPKNLEQGIITRLCELISLQGEMLPGVYDLLSFLKQSGYRIGLATSSSEVVVDTVLNKLNIREFFDVVRSADLEPYGKPHPSVYLSVAQLLTTEPKNCLVIEDSLTGLIAAKAATMKTFIVNDRCAEPKFSFADKQFLTLTDVLNLLQSKHA